MNLLPDIQPEYFGNLYAESETEWLEHVFVQPDGIRSMLSMRSVVVIGRSGSGKSTLATILTEHVAQSSPLLTVLWRPSVPKEYQDPSMLLHQYFEEIFTACSHSLLTYIRRRPQSYLAAIPTAQQAAAWFVQHFIRQDHRFLSRLSSGATEDAVRALRLILLSDFPTVFKDNTSETYLVREFADLMTELKINGAWLIIDGLDKWRDLAPDKMTTTVVGLLSSLSWFEVDKFSLKLMVPQSMEASVLSSSGVSSKRLDTFYLTWTRDQLIKVVERRMRLATRNDKFELADLAATSKLLSILDKYGGQVPRGWLTLVRPFVDAYLLQNSSSDKAMPISDDDFDNILMKNQPRLRIDRKYNHVYLGFCQIDDLPPHPMRILSYLYEHAGTVCSREDLYYRAIEEMDDVPEKGEKGYQNPDSWKSRFENTVLHLRQRIEDDFKNPVYVITKRGQGLILENVW
mgnify:CR=1 FL=1